MNVPTALASAADTATRVAELTRARRASTVKPKPVLATWIGADDAASRAFEAAGIPHYATESDAVRGFMHVARWSEARDALMETPPSLPEHFTPDVDAARRVIDGALSD